jgi:hypothetical protein
MPPAMLHDARTYRLRYRGCPVPGAAKAVAERTLGARGHEFRLGPHCAAVDLRTWRVMEDSLPEAAVCTPRLVDSDARGCCRRRQGVTALCLSR